MKKIKMLVSISGSEYSAAPGDVIEIADDEATRLVNAGFAELVSIPTPAPKPVAPAGSKK